MPNGESLIPDAMITAAKAMRAANVPDNEILDALFQMSPGDTAGYRYGISGLVLRGLDDPSLGINTMDVYKADVNRPKATPTFDLSGKRTNVVIADLHIPLHRKDLIMDISQRHEGGRLIIAGDIQDNTKASKYLNVNTVRSRFKDYYIDENKIHDMTMELFIEMSPYWDEIIVIRGNHDYRKTKNQALTNGGDGTLADEYLLSQLRTYVRNIVIPNERGVDYYAVKIGDLWAGHWGWYGASPCHGVRKVVTDFLPRPQIKAKGDCRVVVHGHTHKAAECICQYVWAIECGAMCHTPDYVDEGFGKSGDPQLGYAVIVQEDGHLIQRESKTIKYGFNDYIHYLDGTDIYNS